VVGLAFFPLPSEAAFVVPWIYQYQAEMPRRATHRDQMALGAAQIDPLQLCCAHARFPDGNRAFFAAFQSSDSAAWLSVREEYNATAATTRLATTTGAAWMIVP
jgi:hypothetical protein